MPQVTTGVVVVDAMMGVLPISWIEMIVHPLTSPSIELSHLVPFLDLNSLKIRA